MKTLKEKLEEIQQPFAHNENKKKYFILTRYILVRLSICIYE